MKNIKKTLITTIFILIILSTIQNVNADTEKPIVTLVYPEPDGISRTITPTIEIQYTDESSIDLSSIKLIIDGYNIPNDWDELDINPDGLTYEITQLTRLKEGNHTIQIELQDSSGNTAIEQWEFIVDLSIPPQEQTTIDIMQIVTYIMIGALIIALAFIAYILYLKKTKKFTFRKYFAQHPLQKQYLVLYLPLLTSFLFVIFSLAYVANTDELPTFSNEYVLVIGLFIAVTPYALDSQIERKRKQKYERGFSQFLFEMADAMRGGLDPAKAVIELGRTDTGILKDHLKKAGESIRLGRPFDEVMKTMVKPFKSDLITRYATLIGDASQVGGETSQVIHRAAKDMDDFIKVNMDRRRQLSMQTMTIYISFIVLLIIIYLLLTMFPSLEDMDLSLLSGGSLENIDTAKTITRMNLLTLKQRFLHIVLINSIGTGAVIGAFVDGKIKYGLVHVLAMTVVSILFFAILLL